MKNIIKTFLLILIAATAYRCGDMPGSSKSLSLTGNINGAGSMQVFLDKVGISPTSASLVVAKTEATPTGEFSFSLPEGAEPGLYRIRIGAQRATLVLDGTESNISLSGNLIELNRFNYKVEGSESSVAYRDMMQKLAGGKASLADVTSFVQNTPNPLAGALVATQSLGNNRKYVDVFNQAKDRLAAEFPNSSYASEFDTYIASLKKVVTGGKGFKFIEESQRQPAPEIKLPSPSGKVYALSDLKGKVVLLDFWASWCRPCRAENPNVVRIYDKYKDKGFTVFSVSLDGIDSRTAARYGNDPTKVATAREAQKKRWIDAIKKDKLVWETHVSDLKKWECVPARTYGVSSIPRTFMIDKNGNIAAMNLRGAEQIEETLLKLL
ncbi:MAG TPA: TlpA family protein disulfide reductase [Bacteroidetes bacterium]|nr:TlpA family protein disulfide reductase [Bacteroidota bacterium]